MFERLEVQYESVWMCLNFQDALASSSSLFLKIFNWEIATTENGRLFQIVDIKKKVKSHRTIGLIRLVPFTRESIRISTMKSVLRRSISIKRFKIFWVQNQLTYQAHKLIYINLITRAFLRTVQYRFHTPNVLDRIRTRPYHARGKVVSSVIRLSKGLLSSTVQIRFGINTIPVS